MTLTIGFPAKLQINARFAMNLIEALDQLKTKLKTPVNIKYLLGKSNIAHARSILLTEWYDQAKPNDLFMFIDTDQVFEPSDIIRVTNLSGDLRAGIYANRANLHTSIPSGYEFKTAENIPLDFAATGFLCITYKATKKVHEWMKVHEQLDRVTISDDPVKDETCIPFFHPLIENLHGKRYWLGEDFSFSLRARKANQKIMGVILHSLGHELPYVGFFNKPIRKPIEWSNQSIVYYCGNSRIRFGPSSTDLGGSEKAVVNLSEQFAKAGYDVTVYGNVEPTTQNDVIYKRYEEFVTNDHFNIIILWRGFGLEALPNITWAKKILVDLHDVTDPNKLLPHFVEHKVTKIFVKSNYHKTLYKHLPVAKFVVQPNGLEIEKINMYKPELRANQNEMNKTHFCYTSSYNRGLIPILQYLWPKIKQHYEDATFHIRYGNDFIDEDTLLKLEELLKQPGVFEYGRSSFKETILERYKSSIQLYLTNTMSEVDCLSIREAAYVGCVPLISNSNVFSERAGIHIEGDINKVETFYKAFEAIRGYLELPNDKKKVYTQALKEASIPQTWTEVAQKWIDVIKSL